MRKKSRESLLQLLLLRPSVRESSKKRLRKLRRKRKKPRDKD